MRPCICPSCPRFGGARDVMASNLGGQALPFLDSNQVAELFRDIFSDRVASVRNRDGLRMEPPVCGGRDDRRTRNPFCRCTPKEMAAPRSISPRCQEHRMPSSGRVVEGRAMAMPPRFGIRLCRVGKQADGDAGCSRPCYQKRDVIGLLRASPAWRSCHRRRGLGVMHAGDLNA